MAYSRRGRHWYASVRNGHRVRTLYLGAGALGAAAAALHDERRAERDRVRREQLEAREQVVTENRKWDALVSLGRTLAAAALTAGGYHQHRGQWRRARP